MLLQTVRLARFVSPHIPTGKMKFQGLGEYVKHEEWIAVFIFHLFSGFAVDGNADRCIGKKKVDKLSENSLQVFERKNFEESGEGEVDGGSPFSSQAAKWEEGT